MNNLTKKSLALAIGCVLGTSALPVQAETLYAIESSFGGWFTFINGSGTGALNNPDSSGSPGYGYRTPITGTLFYDTHLDTGSMDIAPFSFGGSGPIANINTTFQNIGNGAGGSGNLLLGNLSFDWNGNIGIPMSIVWDATGLFDALDGGISIGDLITGGALPTTDAFGFDFGKLGTYTIPIGPSPIASTTFNTTAIGTVSLGTNPSGTLPLTDDGIGGSPMLAGPFPGFNINFDFTSLHLTSVAIIDPVPVPASVWLFGSGLLGLIGMARRKKSA